MPYKMRKLPQSDYYKVYNTETGTIHSKHATKKNAKAQMRILDNQDDGNYPKEQDSEMTGGKIGDRDNLTGLIRTGEMIGKDGKPTGRAIYNPNKDPAIDKQNAIIRDNMNKSKIFIHHNEISGGKLSASDLKGLLEASYDGRASVGDFQIDKALSTSNSKVYFNPNTKQAVVAHKGTSGFTDWGNNAVYALGGEWAYKKTKRYKDAEKVQKKAESKYGAKNISTIGHSQGGLQSELLGKNTNETITLDKATRPFSNTKADNQYDIRSKNDVVSALNPFQKENKKEIVLDSDTYNPLTSHDIGQLDKLAPDQMIGQGANHKGRKKGAKNKVKPVVWKAPPELHDVLGFHAPYTKPIGSYTTTWRNILYKEKELQGITYPKAMKDPRVKELYYEVKEQLEEENGGEKPDPDEFMTLYLKMRPKRFKEVKQPKPTKKPTEDPTQPKIDTFLPKPKPKPNIALEIEEKEPEPANPIIPLVADKTDEIDLPDPTPAPVNIEPVVSKIVTKIGELKKEGEKHGLGVKYSSEAIIGTLVYLKLLEKYGNKCAVITTDIAKIGKLNSGIAFEGISINSKQKGWEKSTIDYLGETLKDCIDRGVDLILIPLDIKFNSSNVGHANMIVYRPLQRIVERFEPHGAEYGNSEQTDIIFNNLLKDLFETQMTKFLGKLRFKTPDEICPNSKGFQSFEGQLKGFKAVEGGGFCMMWSCFLAEMIFMNPDKSTKEIIDEVFTITNKEPEYLKQVIRGYVKDAEKMLDDLIKAVSTDSFKFIKRWGNNSSTNVIRQHKQLLENYILQVIFNSKQSVAPQLVIPEEPDQTPSEVVTKAPKQNQDIKARLERCTKSQLDKIFSNVAWKMVDGVKRSYSIKGNPNKERMVSIFLTRIEDNDYEGLTRETLIEELEKINK